MLKILTAIAGMAMTLSYYPQIYRIIKTRDVKSLSLLTYVLFSFGTIIWTIYGLVYHEWVVFLSYVPGVLGSWTIMILIILLRRRKNSHGL